MTNTNKDCCDKCLDYGYDSEKKCFNPSCDCHSPQPKEESWELEFGKKFSPLQGRKGYMPVEMYDHSEMTESTSTTPQCQKCQPNPETIVTCKNCGKRIIN